MRTILIINLLFLLGLGANAQRFDNNNDVRTVFGNGGGFGGFLEVGVKAGEINDQTGLLVGGSLKAVFSSCLNIGLAGYGLTSDIEADTYGPDNRQHYLTMGYGGIVFEPVIGNKRMVHITVPVLLGVGGTALREERFIAFDDDDFDIDQYRFRDDDVFLIAEPGLNIEINLFRNLRLDMGASYRYIHDSDIDGINDDELGGFTTQVGLKLGWF